MGNRLLSLLLLWFIGLAVSACGADETVLSQAATPALTITSTATPPPAPTTVPPTATAAPTQTLTPTPIPTQPPATATALPVEHHITHITGHKQYFKLGCE